MNLMEEKSNAKLWSQAAIRLLLVKYVVSMSFQEYAFWIWRDFSNAQNIHDDKGAK